MPKNPAAVELGKIKSKRKAQTSAKNGKDNRPGIRKCAHFESIYPYKLTCNEWKDKFLLGTKTPTGRNATYNPDFFCKKTGYYIEVTTSKPNIAEQGWKWARVIKSGVKLKVFWWEGQDITNDFK